MDELFINYLKYNDKVWDYNNFDKLYSQFPNNICECCDGHLFLHCGYPCHKGFDVHGKCCSGCDNDKIMTLIRYETKFEKENTKYIISSEFDNNGFLNYLVLTNNNSEITIIKDHNNLCKLYGVIDVDVYYKKCDVYDDNN